MVYFRLRFTFYIILPSLVRRIQILSYNFTCLISKVGNKSSHIFLKFRFFPKTSWFGEKPWTFFNEFLALKAQETANCKSYLMSSIALVMLRQGWHYAFLLNCYSRESDIKVFTKCLKFSIAEFPPIIK